MTRALFLFLPVVGCGLRSVPDAGGAGGGAAGGSAGGTAGGAQLPYRVSDGGDFTLQDLSPVQGAPAPRYDNLSGVSAGHVVVTNALGQVQRFDGGSWSTLLDIDPSPACIGGLFVSPTGRIFFAADDRLYRCLGSCEQAGSWKVETKPGRVLESVCGSNALVYAAGYDSSSQLGYLYERSPATDSWTELTYATGVASEYRDCALSAGGLLYVAARRYVVEVDILGSTAMQVDLAPGRWNAAAVIGDEVVLAGDEG